MANSFEEDNDAPMDTIEDNDIEMSASDPVVNEAPNSKENNNANDEDNNSQNSDDSTPKSTQSPQSLSSPSNDNDTTQQHESSLLTQMNEWITTMPPKMEQCSKAQFYAVLLLRIEVENINATHKIDYLLLFNFIQNTPPFKAFPFLTFGENVSKLAKDDILKLFTEKTDFDAPKLSQIFDAISTNDTTETIHKFQQNASQIDLPQTAAKFQKCASELSTPNIDTEGDDDEDMEEEETKEHVQDEERMQFKVGNKIDCRDQWGVWCVSEIKRHKKATELLIDLEREDIQGLEGIYVHYEGWDKKYDEWIFVDADGDIFCNCSDKCENKELNQHLIAREKTQTVYAKRRTKPKPPKIEPIQYKIESFEELVQYIDSNYEAPRGRNRTGMGAERYAMATVNGPGGNLQKFKVWDKQKQYDRFHHSHYDWWMFPNDRHSWGQGKRYALFQKDIDELLEVDGYPQNYKMGTRLVLRSWGWDMDRMAFIEDGTRDQRWTGYNVRLLKMLYSTIILKQWDVYKSVYEFCIGLLKKGHQFRSEPMMYEYLGLEKPKYVSRYRW
eukprot:50367_1